MADTRYVGTSLTAPAAYKGQAGLQFCTIFAVLQHSAHSDSPRMRNALHCCIPQSLSWGHLCQAEVCFRSCAAVLWIKGTPSTCYGHALMHALRLGQDG